MAAVRAQPIPVSPQVCGKCKVQADISNVTMLYFTQNHDVMHKAFLGAASVGLMPYMEGASASSQDKLNSKYPKRNDYFSIITVGPGLDRVGGARCQLMLEDFGPAGGLEIGPASIEPHNQEQLSTKLINIDISNGKLQRLFDYSRYGCNQVAAALVERQELI